jgi:IS5 family transposase
VLHGDKNAICADAGYTGVEKRNEHAMRIVFGQIVAWRSSCSALLNHSLISEGKRRIDRAKAQTQAPVVHPAQGIKRKFG